MSENEKTIQEIILYEVRQNRSEIKKNRDEIHGLKMNVFANKVKLGSLIVGLTITANLVYVFIAEKVKLFINS